MNKRIIFSHYSNTFSPSLKNVSSSNLARFLFSGSVINNSKRPSQYKCHSAGANFPSSYMQYLNADAKVNRRLMNRECRAGTT